ncbi:unnamed protein product [Trichobilharzia regenti]|nr:unnamed protein product [Trichobilharzia regenti]
MNNPRPDINENKTRLAELHVLFSLNVSILAYAYSSNNQNHQDDNCIVDPILIIECQIEKTNKSYGDLCKCLSFFFIINNDDSIDC